MGLNRSTSRMRKAYIYMRENYPQGTYQSRIEIGQMGESKIHKPGGRIKKKILERGGTM